MRIMFYIATIEHEGGAERVMTLLANAICKRGHDVLLVNDFKYIGTEYYIDANITRLYLAEDNSGSVLRKNINRITKLRQILKSCNPDIVISFLYAQNIRLLVSAVGLKIKTIISVRNDPKHEFGEHGLKKKIISMIYGWADGIVFQTREEKDFFGEKIAQKSRIILNPIEDNFYSLKRSDNPKDIISVGRITKQKNQKLLIDAFALIREKFPNDNLYIYGEGDLKPYLKRYIIDKGIDKYVFLPGKIEDVGEVLSKGKLFVLSSDYEGLPNVVMESMAAGIPVISTSSSGGGAQMLVKDGFNGRLVSCGNLLQMVSAIEECLGNKYILNKYSQNGKETAENFRTNHIVDQWMKYIKDIAI